MIKYLVVLLVAIAFTQFSESKPAYQVLIPKTGFVPVFIRYGNQPLSEIDPVLAEAFGEAKEISPRNIKIESDTTMHKLAQSATNIFNKYDGASESIIKDLPNLTGFATKKR